MLLVGIDEAGYGPTLGPMCHGRSIFRLPDADADADLWERLHPVVSRTPAPEGAIEVDDSKRVHAGPHKFDRLRRSVRAFAACLPEAPPGPRDASLLERLLPRADDAELTRYPWWHEDLLSESGSQDQSDGAGDLRGRLRERDIALLDLRVRAMDARRFNAGLERLGNKADLAWEQVSELIREAIESARDGEEVRFIIDRQGGRKFYAGRVSALTGAVLPQVEEESARRSAYRCRVGGREWRLAFMEKAESASLPVALASLAAKWVREFLMARFNAFFLKHDPALQPTAGYPTDAMRFLRQTESLRRRLGIPDEALIRRK